MSHPHPVALITGASRGLGLALARALAVEGWSLVITARGARALEAARVSLQGSGEAIALPGDVTDPSHRAALVEAVRGLGRLDALVNNASTLGQTPLPAVLDLDLGNFEQVLATNLLAPLALVQAMAPHLAPDARVLAPSSDAALGAYPGWGAYGSSKAALDQLMRVLGAEQPGWRVYAVDPGDMRTQMHQDAFPGEDLSDRPEPEASVPGLLTLLRGGLPSGRYIARALPAPVGV